MTADRLAPRDELRAYLAGTVAAGLPPVAAESLLTFADAMVAAARGPLDVERLAKALMPRHLFSHDGWICHPGVDEKAANDLARLIAAEYVALRKPVTA